MNCYQLLTETNTTLCFPIVAVINTYLPVVHHPPASQRSLLPARLNDSIPSSSVPKLSAPRTGLHACSLVCCGMPPSASDTW